VANKILFRLGIEAFTLKLVALHTVSEPECLQYVKSNPAHNYKEHWEVFNEWELLILSTNQSILASIKLNTKLA
jgi:hypothetical protein